MDIDLRRALAAPTGLFTILIIFCAKPIVAQNQIGLEQFSTPITLAEGLGPRFNARSCNGCHGYPTPGGDEGFCESCVVTRFGARSKQGKFEPLARLGGPILQRYSESLNKGGFGYLEEHLPTSSQVPGGALVTAFRRPPYLFGVGLIEGISEETIRAYAARHSAHGGRVSLILDPRTGETRVGRFGWKAQFPDLKAVTSDALLEEHGIEPAETGRLREDALVVFQRSLPAPSQASHDHVGESVFNRIGCANCHVKKLSKTQPFYPYSDFLLHEMGQDGDGIGEGGAKGSEMRTAPLWGVMLRFPQGLNILVPFIMTANMWLTWSVVFLLMRPQRGTRRLLQYGDLQRYPRQGGKR